MAKNLLKGVGPYRRLISEAALADVVAAGGNASA